MSKNIVIAGSGFAGTWAALAAARARTLADQDAEVTITVVSPIAELCIRPRLYEASLENLAPDIAPLLAAAGVRHIAGTVEAIHASRHVLDVVGLNGERSELHYDRFVLAAGSRLFMPDVPGLREHAFNVDQLDSARVLDAHLRSLPDQPEAAARNTVVVAGGGFTGIETATEMPARLRAILGAESTIRVVVLEQAAAIGPDLGPVPRPYIVEALAVGGVDVMTSTGVVAIDAGGVTTSRGERIETETVVWTAGSRAHPLAAHIAGEHDRFGRVHADPYLRAIGVEDVFVAGDVAHAATDDQGNVAMMSCQHALSLGRVAGHNAAAELVGLPLHVYRQPKYVTCLDLGSWGAIFTEGWDRQVQLTREEGKATKREINTKWIYPPAPDSAAVFDDARPDFVIVP
jgi:NADH dehydrogenase